jgi:hypothetical protein
MNKDDDQGTKASGQQNECALPDLDQDLSVGAYSKRIGIRKCIGGRPQTEGVAEGWYFLFMIGSNSRVSAHLVVLSTNILLPRYLLINKKLCPNCARQGQI